MPDKIRWGILSTASIARGRVLPAWKNLSNGVVAAVASRDLARAQDFAKDMGIPKAYGSYEELIADPDIDAIYNPLPNSLHAEWSIRCAEAGKPTLCEKPLASDAREAQKIVDAFASQKVLFAEAFMYRFHPQTQHVKQMVESGALGDLRTVQASFSFAIRQEDDIRLSKPLAGGGLMDVGCYCLNLMRLMTGEEPSEVRAIGRWGRRSQVDENLAGTLLFPSGVIGHFDCSLRSYLAHTYELRGSKGRIVVDEGFVVPPDRDTFIRYWHDNLYEQIKIAPANSYTLMGEDFGDAILKGRPPRFPAQDAVRNMELIDRVYSVAQGQG